jgi:hypothetical protein
MDESVVHFLDTHDAACPRCGYNLRAAEASICPECGLHLKLAIVRARGSVVPWCALLVATSLVGGVGIPRWVLEAIHGLPSLRAELPAVGWYWYVLHFAVLASPLVLVAVLLGRHWLMRRRPSVQWALAALAASIFVLECLSLVR